MPDGTDARVNATVASIRAFANPDVVGQPFLPGAGYHEAVQAVKHFLADEHELREVSVSSTMKLLGDVREGRVTFDDIDEIMGASEEALRRHGIPRREWELCGSIVDDSKFIVVDMARDSGKMLDRWRRDIDFVAASLAGQLVLFGRLGWR